MARQKARRPPPSAPASPPSCPASPPSGPTAKSRYKEYPPPPAPLGNGTSCDGALLAGHHEVPDDMGHGPIVGHPESVERVRAPLARLKKSGFWRSLRKLQRRVATDEELLFCHSEAHLSGLKELSRLAGSDKRPRFVPRNGPLCQSGPCCEVREGAADTDTYVTAGSLEVARASAGAVMQLVDEVVAASVEGTGASCGFAMCRPPGHHASRARSSGFCLVNNIGVGAAYALERHPEIERVLIFDWDVHHGQGTQQIFEQSAQVLVVNVHRHDGASFYPGTGGAKEVGSGPGRGYTVNVPLPQGYGDAALWSACTEVVLPAARRFDPDLIMVSAGFDAAMGDPLGGCKVSPRMFGAITAELKRLAMEVAEGRLIMALEGGYDPTVLSDCIEQVMESLVSDCSSAISLDSSAGSAFAAPPAWLEDAVGAASCRGPIRKTCEAHHTLPLRLPVPCSKADRKRAGAAVREAALKQDNAVLSQEIGSDAVAKADAVATAASHAAAVEDTDQPAVSESTTAPEEADDLAACEELEAPATSDGEANAAEGDDEITAAGSDDVSAQLELLVEKQQVKIRISPLSDMPKDVSVSASELRLLLQQPQSGADGGAADTTTTRRWSFEGLQVDTVRDLLVAEFRPKRRELTLRLALGPILGGAVGIKPLKK